MKLVKCDNRGDTIVEVLISIAVVSLLLGGAFASARNSQIAGQRARERDEGVKLLEQQAEYLRSVSVSQPSELFASTLTAAFCLSNGTTIVDPADAGCPKGTEGRYRIAITKGAASNIFTILVTWDRAGGGVEERLESYYRVHPGATP